MHKFGKLFRIPYCPVSKPYVLHKTTSYSKLSLRQIRVFYDNPVIFSVFYDYVKIQPFNRNAVRTDSFAEYYRVCVNAVTVLINYVFAIANLKIIRVVPAASNHRIIACPAVHSVVALSAVEVVIASLTVQHIIPVLCVYDVIAAFSEYYIIAVSSAK